VWLYLDSVSLWKDETPASPRSLTLAGLQALSYFLKKPNWHESAEGVALVKPVIMRLAAAYFLTAKRTDSAGVPTSSTDSVAHFHLGNGAQVENLNWLGDTSEKGLQQSFGMMVNYRYKLDEVGQNHERYHTECKIQASKHVYELYCSI